MNDMLKGIDTIMISNAQVALFRLSHGDAPESVNRGAIKAFREVLSKMCDESKDQEIQTFLDEIIHEFHTNHPCRRRMDMATPTPQGVMKELDWLIDNRPSVRSRAERLYGFCYFFYKHINGKRNTASLVHQAVST